jgi:site-specific recombinase XerD
MKLLDQVRNVIIRKHYSIRTEQAYLSWIKNFIGYHKMRHPRDMGVKEIESFLTHLAHDRKVASSTQNQAFNAILFLYRDVLGIKLEESINASRAKKPARIPCVLTHEEACLVIDNLHDTFQTMARLLYGCGLRLMECVRLRVHDLDFEKGLVYVRGAKGGKDRTTLFPKSIHEQVVNHITRVRMLHEKDYESGEAIKGAPAKVQQGAQANHQVLQAAVRHAEGACQDTQPEARLSAQAGKRAP